GPEGRCAAGVWGAAAGLGPFVRDGGSATAELGGGAPLSSAAGISRVDAWPSACHCVEAAAASAPSATEPGSAGADDEPKRSAGADGEGASPACAIVATTLLTGTVSPPRPLLSGST